MKKIFFLFFVFILIPTTYSQTFENLVIDPSPQENPDPHIYYELNNQLLFKAYSTEHGTELWTTDGTQEGTYLLKDIIEGPISSTPYYLTIFQDKAIFGTSSDNGIWVTDGTTNGTIKLTEENLNPMYKPSFGFIVYNNKTYFCCKDDNLWETDGTIEGTKLFMEDVHVTYAFVYKDQLYFNKTNNGGSELWKTDGSIEGTHLFYSTNENGFSNPSRFTIMNDKLIYLSFHTNLGDQLYASDGTIEGTILLTDYITDYITNLVVYNDKIYFFCDTNNDEKVDLWCCDGTVDGSYKIKDFDKSIYGSFYLTVYKDLLYFVGLDDEHGQELWVSDGTIEGTQIFIDLTPGYSGSAFRNLNVYNDLLFFLSNDQNDNNQLYFTDGIAEHTKILTNTNATNPDPFSYSGSDKMYEMKGSLYFKARYTSPDFDQLWKLTFNTSILNIEPVANTTLAYPNPFSHYFQIDVKENIKLISIFTTTGQLVKEYQSVNQMIDGSDLKPGTYFIRAVSDKKIYHTSITKQ